MSNSKWLSFKLWVFQFIANIIPECSKRFVLYELQMRVIQNNVSWNDDKDMWSITFENMYDTLKD